ncbi:MAG: arsenate reductase ArsC [Flavobacteriales bacterium]|nr:arsenate reductase ArsC [Flavobacteriales bacterium]
MKKIPHILVLCTGNSCRSQMAEGYLKMYGGGALEVSSAGTHPQGLNPKAARVMLEDGLDISQQTSNHVDEFLNRSVDVVLTVCDDAKENCPFFPGDVKRIHHAFSDPAKASGSEEEILESFRRVRDQIKAYCKELASEIVGG